MGGFLKWIIDLEIQYVEINEEKYNKEIKKQKQKPILRSELKSKPMDMIVSKKRDGKRKVEWRHLPETQNVGW